MTDQELLGSLALDLRRVAMGYHRGSDRMACMFANEARMRAEQLQDAPLAQYLAGLIGQLKRILGQRDHQKLAEDALMYSILFQNAAVHSHLSFKVKS